MTTHTSTVVARILREI